MLDPQLLSMAGAPRTEHCSSDSDSFLGIVLVLILLLPSLIFPNISHYPLSLASQCH